MPANSKQKDAQLFANVNKTALNC